MVCNKILVVTPSPYFYFADPYHIFSHSAPPHDLKLNSPYSAMWCFYVKDIFQRSVQIRLLCNRLRWNIMALLFRSVAALTPQRKFNFQFPFPRCLPTLHFSFISFHAYLTWIHCRSALICIEGKHFMTAILQGAKKRNVTHFFWLRVYKGRGLIMKPLPMLI